MCVPDEDFSDSIDVDALARLLATPKFDVEACRERIATYVREGDGEAGRGIEKIAGALKAHLGDRLAEHKPALIAQLTCSRHGEFSSNLGHRSYGVLGHAIWHHYDSTQLLDANPFTILSLMEVLHDHGEIDQIARDLVSWVELGDRAARRRLQPIVERAKPTELYEPGYSIEVEARLLDVLAMAGTTVEDKIERIYATLDSQTQHGLRSFALFLEELDGPCDAPPYESTEEDRAVFEVMWRLSRRYRACFDRHSKALAAHLGSDEALHLLGIIDEEVELPKAGARGVRWRIMRAGRLVMTTTGEVLDYLPRFTVTAAASEAAARKSFAKKLEAKRAAKPSPRKR